MNQLMMLNEMVTINANKLLINEIESTKHHVTRRTCNHERKTDSFKDDGL